MFKCLSLLVLLSAPAYADELQFQITGEASNTVDGGDLGPMQLDFMLDTAAGVQNFVMNGQTLVRWSVTDTTLTNFSYTVNGKTVLAALSIPVTMGGSGILDALFNAMGFPGGTIEWDSQASRTPADLTGIFTTSFVSPLGTIAGINFSATGSGVSVKAISVPEPGILPMMVLGLLLLAARPVQWTRPARVRKD